MSEARPGRAFLTGTSTEANANFSASGLVVPVRFPLQGPGVSAKHCRSHSLIHSPSSPYPSCPPLDVSNFSGRHWRRSSRALCSKSSLCTVWCGIQSDRQRARDVHVLHCPLFSQHFGVDLVRRATAGLSWAQGLPELADTCLHLRLPMSLATK